ncbi:3-hydroxy-3-methylglutaryl coenzyme A synthase [Acrodontium crateriforme]|uniref:Hydroxymethylglutaryl-CoA synthase n=1 Tax=Acrodontium crateriforme TaxID=150365 RepID=A0AAQ3MA32_9PEZI|nr:3-hydroxy-3-methylglutaryl coenzyme A synthase [Acrodontium crateriforme]
MPHAISPSVWPTSLSSGRRFGPTNVGIKAIELYFPDKCVAQSELEKHDGVSEGKYTIGLGQTRMSFCDDREDIYSITLTALSSLLRKYQIDTKTIGRLEVGTETLLDKSKSVKSVLMQLFADTDGNMEGVDNINACYGGTNALFNAVNWVESSSWDGRDAIVVCGDVAVYGKGAARPTGGAGAVAMLIGPDAPIAFQSGLRGSYFQHTYDFYKADLRTEYPIVQGHYSIECYTRALDSCYAAYCKREQQLYGFEASSDYASDVEGEKAGSFNYAGSDSESEANTRPASESGDSITSYSTPTIAERFDHMCFHAPTTKLVSKSYARLIYNDFKAHPNHADFKALDPSLLNIEYESSLRDRTIEKTFVNFSANLFTQRVSPSTMAPTMCGNMYTASLYSGLASLLSNVAPAALFGKTIGMFSFGSGLASTLFSLKVVGDTTQMHEALDLVERLSARQVVSPEAYDAAMGLREAAHLQKDFVPQGDCSRFKKGTYYLTKVDDQFRREYAVAV